MIVGITSHAQNASPSGQNRSDLDPQLKIGKLNISRSFATAYSLG